MDLNLKKFFVSATLYMAMICKGTLPANCANEIHSNEIRHNIETTPEVLTTAQLAKGQSQLNEALILINKGYEYKKQQDAWIKTI